MWLQEIEPDDGYQDTRTEVGSGKCVGQLQLIIFVLDHARLVQNRERPRVYTGVFLEVLRWVNKRATDKVHRMLEVEKQPVHTAKNPRLLGARRFYNLSNIIRSVHLIPVNEKFTRFFVNNYIDWDQYNTVYDPEFIAKRTRVADNWEKSTRRRR